MATAEREGAELVPASEIIDCYPLAITAVVGANRLLILQRKPKL
jgi:hypothetical protein